MSRVLTNEQNYYDIADTIRQMKNVNTTYKPREMASALKDIYSNEVEGVPPLSFEANGNFLLDYRIDGASGGVGDRTKNLVDKTKFTYGYRLSATGTLYTTPSEQNLFAVSGFIKVNANEQYIISQRSSIGGYARRIAFYREEEESTWISNNDDSDLSFTVPNEALYLRFTTIQSVVDNIMLSKGTSLPDTYEPYGYKVPVVVSGKNLLQNKATSITLNGVTCTVNDDKSVTFTGSPERSFDLIFNNSLILNPGTYIYTNGLTQSYSRIRVDMYVAGTGGNINYWANPSVTFTIANTYKFVSRIFIQGNAGELAGLTIYPMVRESSITDDTYEPYIEPTTTNIYLDKPIEAKANIPSEYTEVEYLESTGTQYIDTGINVNTTTSRYETKINPSSVSGTMGIFGTRNYSSAAQSSMNVFIIGGTFRLDWLSGNGNYTVRNISSDTEYTISITRGLATINNVDYTSGETTSIYSPYTFYVGSFNNVGSVYSTGFSGKIYYSKLYNNNILVFDGVPCYRKSDNEIGMYDLVSNTFFTNAGTGNFIVGPIKENESISLSDTNKNIPTIDGTNTLTINTTIQPSNVYVQAPKDSIEATMIANALEEI